MYVAAPSTTTINRNISIRKINELFPEMSRMSSLHSEETQVVLTLIGVRCASEYAE